MRTIVAFFIKNKYSLIGLFAFLFVVTNNGLAQHSAQALTDVFEKNSLRKLDKKGFHFTDTYTPSESTWGIDSFPESVVFQAALSYQNKKNPDQSYQLRIGKGGQIYSLVGSFGESVPPQRRGASKKTTTYGAGKDYAPWVDEVWQMVCVNTQKNDVEADEAYFIHQAGVYLRTPEQKQPFYSPIVASYYNEKEQSFTTVNWGQQAHTSDNLKMGYTSSLLYYTRYTNMGQGVIQVDYMIYNFGQDEIDHYNAPWGGVRSSSLEQPFITKPDYSYRPLEGSFGKNKPIRVNKTGGWITWSADAKGQESSLAIVLTKETSGKTNFIRYGQAGNKTSPRDYYVFTTTKKPKAGQLAFGKALSNRYYFVLESSIESVKDKVIKHDLTKHAFDAASIPQKSKVEDLVYQFEQKDSKIKAVISDSGLSLKARPYANSYPLFLIQAADGRQQITSNLYHFSKLPYDGTTTKIDLLGFLDKPTKVGVKEETVLDGESYTFTDGTVNKNPQTGTSHISKMTAQEVGYDSLVVTNITIGSSSATKNSKTTDASKPKPNVILLLTDDLGWQDVKCYDIDEPSPYETPNMDALAKEGVLFWQAYSPAPTCAPSRCAIMSGNHPARAQTTHVSGGKPPMPTHKTAQRMMQPWYSGRMPANEMTLARALQNNGYTTGHSGKWHMAVSHKAFPQPEDQGFDYTSSERGKTSRMKPHRLTGFSTGEPSEEYPIDENGFVIHQPTQDALQFIKEKKDQPFFLYYAEWLVHAPIQTRNKRLLDKYCKKLGVEIPSDPDKWTMEGQNNPFYCAMVEELDYHVGEVIHYLKTTDDPRWKGHKLIENTYIIFTSDNGGMEGHPGEIITDNYPLDQGKISAMEGGTRVPLIITGPRIEKGVQSDVMVNGLDFYPTILSLVDAEMPKGKHLDGADISTLLLKDPTDPKLVKDKNGQERNTMIWHFPNSVDLESTIRVGDYKLIKNYDHVNNDKTEPLELYRLYNSEKGKSIRVDIEESKNLVESEPELTQKLEAELTKRLTEMKASYPYYNPYYKHSLPHKEKTPTVTAETKEGDKVSFTFKENGAKVVRAQLIYTLNGGERYEEWFRTPATVVSNTQVTATLPEGTTHYLINLIDEHNFLVSYPEVVDLKQKKKKVKYSVGALSVGE